MFRNPSTKAPKEKQNTLFFRQVSIGKGGDNMNVALQQEWEVGAHVVVTA